MIADTEVIARAWGRIEAWLQQHAPNSHRALRPPATDEEAAEALTHVPVPGELLALLHMHNGADGYQMDGDEEGEVNPAAFLPHGAPYSVSEILHAHTLYSDPGIGSLELRRYVPWAGSDDGFHGLYVDAGDGTLGRFTNPPDFYDLPYESIAEYLHAVADAVESGTGPLAEDPDTVPGIAHDCLIWDDPENMFLSSSEWVPLR